MSFNLFEMAHKEEIMIGFYSTKFHVWEYKGKNGPQKNCDVADLSLGTFLFHSLNNHVRHNVCLAFCHQLDMQRR